MRALRPGKLTLAALEATLRLYVTGPDTAHREIPVLNMLSGAPAPLERQAKRLHDRMLRKLRESQCEEAVELQVVEGVSAPGGGSLRPSSSPTFCVAVCPVDGRLSADGLKRAMVQEPDTPVVTRVRHDQVLFDVRSFCATPTLTCVRLRWRMPCGQVCVDDRARACRMSRYRRNGRTRRPRKVGLIEALTGKNPDRLEVERRRGMTTELGFGELELPSGKLVGLVDVPGHAHYLRAWCRAPPAWTLRCWRFRPLRA